MSDIPGGTGLGNSSAFTLAFMGAIYKLKQIEASDLGILYNSIELDCKILGEVGGWQDHYISFTGGIKHFTFKKDKVVVERFPFTTLEEHLLNESLLFCELVKKDS
jgi:D-glycero-alpha-D-manno-heptose-7-phosphate kinase